MRPEKDFFLSTMIDSVVQKAKCCTYQYLLVGLVFCLFERSEKMNDLGNRILQIIHPKRHANKRRIASHCALA